MATSAAPANYSQPHTPPIGSAPPSAGERVGSAGRVNSANPLTSPRLKHVKSNPTNNAQEIGGENAPSAPPVAKPQQFNSGVDVQDLLNEMDNHQQNVNAQKRSADGRKNSPSAGKSRESSPTLLQRRTTSPSAHNYHQIRAERDLLNDRCLQLQQQVRSLQLAYKESATRRVQEEQAFREILRSERERFDRYLGRFHVKIEERDTLLLEWAKAVYERNSQDLKYEVKIQNTPELAEGTPNVKDMRNTFALLSARSASIVPSARSYLTPDDIERANSASREEAGIAARRRRRVRSKKAKKDSKKLNKGGKVSAEQEEDEDEENDDDAIGAFRPMPTSKTTKHVAGGILRKKVGAPTSHRAHDEKQNHRSSNNDDEDQDQEDDLSTVTGSIMDIDEYAQRAEALTFEDNQLSVREHILLEKVKDDDMNDETGERPSSNNQDEARKEDADRILQELVDALSLEEQLSDQELSSKNLKNLSTKDGKSKKKGSSSKSKGAPAIVTEASREIEEFLALSAQERETDRILTEFLQQNNQEKVLIGQPEPAPSSSKGSGKQKKRGQSQQQSSQATSSAGSNAARGGTSRTSMSAGTNATFTELNITPLSTASTSISQKQKPTSAVTGKSMEEYVRGMKTAKEAEHNGMFEGLHGMEDTRDLEQQLQDILQSVSDITKSIESSDDFVNEQNEEAEETTGGSAKPSKSAKKVTINTSHRNNVSMKKVQILSPEPQKPLTEEDEQASQLCELLQYASDSIEEAGATVGEDDDDILPHPSDKYSKNSSSAKNTTPKKKKKPSKSVSIQLSTEDELRQIVHDTVKSTAEVTRSSAAQGNVANATRELDTVLLRSSVDFSTTSNNSNSNNSNPSAKLKPSSNQLPPVSGASATASGANTSSGTSAKAQKMVETYLGASSQDALSLIGRPSTSNSAVSSAQSNQRPATTSSNKSAGSAPSSKPSSRGNINNANHNTTVPAPGIAQEGSVSSDNKYWWDISVSGSVEAAPTNITNSNNTNNNTNSNSNSNSNQQRSATGTPRAASSGGVGDSLKLGGELDHH